MPQELTWIWLHIADSHAITASSENGVEAAVPCSAAVPMAHFAIRENVRISSAAGKKALMAVMSVENWMHAPRAFISRTTMEPMPARHRQCSSENTEKRNSFRSMTNCMRPIPSKRRRKYWGRMYRRASRYWRNALH